MVVLCLNFTACGDDDEENSIVGTWKSEVADSYGYTVAFTFNSDGSGIWEEFKDNNLRIQKHSLILLKEIR